MVGATGLEPATSWPRKDIIQSMAGFEMNDAEQGRIVRRNEALATLRAHREDLKRFGIKSLALFGSVARDETGPESDLDLLLEFDGPATFDRYMGLKFYLEDLLGARVDLVMRKALTARLLLSVERDAVRVA